MGADAHEPVRDAVGDAVAFVDDRVEEGQVFEVGDGEGMVGGCGGGGEFVTETGEDGRVGEDLVGGAGEEFGRRDAAGGHEGDACG